MNCVLYCTVEYKEPKTSLTTFKTKTTFLKTLMLEIQFILYLNGPPPKFRETISLIKAWKLLITLLIIRQFLYHSFTNEDAREKKLLTTSVYSCSYQEIYIEEIKPEHFVWNM